MHRTLAEVMTIARGTTSGDALFCKIGGWLHRTYAGCMSDRG